MMIHAYDRDYLYHAQRNLGHMLDFAVNTCDMDLQEYLYMFFASKVCTQFENGNPAYIVGRTGCELCRLVVEEIKGIEIEEEDVMYLDKSPEYWLGWSLAYYVWYRNYKFTYVFNAIPMNEMLGMYSTLHEADITKFISHVDYHIDMYYGQTALTRQRNHSGISQIELSKRSGVNVRVIQSYEQKLRDINKAQVSTVASLAKALDCDIVDLMEKNSPTE